MNWWLQTGYYSDDLKSKLVLPVRIESGDITIGEIKEIIIRDENGYLNELKQRVTIECEISKETIWIIHCGKKLHDEVTLNDIGWLNECCPIILFKTG